MKTTHKIHFGNSNNLDMIKSGSVDLMITSPPYPMIEMWDQMFGEQNPEIKDAIEKKNGSLAFELMNKELDKVWDEVYRVLRPGGIACINIGDATRTIDGTFQLYSSHSRILNHCLKIGFVALPEILWRKQTNAPNKFMGSGMLPPGAYVTLEHEFILILRKGDKRDFIKEEDKENRRQSSFFWEERNIWFSDVWELKGTNQKLNDEKIRDRSAAYPFELAYRLICMFSVKGDVVLDPYFGTGTTMAAAMACGRNSIGMEIDPNFKDTITSRTDDIISYANKYIENRIRKHLDFVIDRTKTKGELKYINANYKFPVMTRQELDILINKLNKIEIIDNQTFEVLYDANPQQEFIQTEPISVVSSSTQDANDSEPSNEKDETSKKSEKKDKSPNTKSNTGGSLSNWI